VRRKTLAMLAFEERLGQPVEVAIVEAINRCGSAPAAAVALDMNYFTLLRWIDKLRIEYRTVGTARLPEAVAASPP